MFTGSVSIYIAFSLQRVLHIPNAHSMFVTGLEFLPQNCIDGPPISSTAEAAVISISVDNKICIHSLTYRRELTNFRLFYAPLKKISIKTMHTISFFTDMMPAWLAILIIVFALFLTFAFCSYIGL